VKGAAMAIRREAIEAIGRFDESFFMYFEEVDLCYRLHLAGWQVHFAPVTTLVHVGEASTMQHRTDMAVQLLASTFQFYRRHYSGIRLAVLGVLLKGIILTRWINDTMRLHVTCDQCKRARITAEVAAWQRVLSMHWREGATLG
jgi:GT2 family glycosyltransferase